jgi:hypothetical protein
MVTLKVLSVIVVHLKGYGMQFIRKGPGLVRHVLILHDDATPNTVTSP